MQLHVPTFSSTSDMMGFIRALPPDAAYGVMLSESFGINDIPEDAESFHKEYFFKYLVQGQHLGLTGEELHAYATRSVDKFDKEFPWFRRPLPGEEVVIAAPKQVTPSKKVKVESTKVKAVKRNDLDKSDGARFLEHRQVWVGYFAGKIQCTKKTKEDVISYVEAKFGVTIQ